MAFVIPVVGPWSIAPWVDTTTELHPMRTSTCVSCFLTLSSATNALGHRVSCQTVALLRRAHGIGAYRPHGTLTVQNHHLSAWPCQTLYSLSVAMACMFARHVPNRTPKGCHGLSCSTSTPASQPTKTDSGPPKKMATYPMWPHRKTSMYALESFECIETRGDHMHYYFVLSEQVSFSQCSTCCPWRWMFDFCPPHLFGQLWWHYAMLYDCHFFL